MKMLSFVGQNWYTENSLVAGVVIAFKFINLVTQRVYQHFLHYTTYYGIFLSMTYIMTIL